MQPTWASAWLSRGDLEHPLDRLPSALNDGVVEGHLRSAVGHAVVQFLESVHFHEAALVAGALLSRRGDELLVGALLLQSVQHADLGGDDHCLGLGVAAVVDHFLGRAHLVGEHANGLGALGVRDQRRVRAVSYTHLTLPTILLV